MLPTETGGYHVVVYWWTGTDPVSRAIEERTAGPYSHVGVALGGTYYEAVPPAVHKMGAVPPGWTSSSALLVCADQLARMTAWAESQLARPYSDLEDAGDALDMDAARADTWNCSAFVAEVLVRGDQLADADERAESPNSLARALGALKVAA